MNKPSITLRKLYSNPELAQYRNLGEVIDEIEKHEKLLFDLLEEKSQWIHESRRLNEIEDRLSEVQEELSLVKPLLKHLIKEWY